MKVSSERADATLQVILDSLDARTKVLRYLATESLNGLHILQENSHTYSLVYGGLITGKRWRRVILRELPFIWCSRGLPHALQTSWEDPDHKLLLCKWPSCIGNAMNKTVEVSPNFIAVRKTFLPWSLPYFKAFLAPTEYRLQFNRLYRWCLLSARRGHEQLCVHLWVWVAWLPWNHWTISKGYTVLKHCGQPGCKVSMQHYPIRCPFCVQHVGLLVPSGLEAMPQSDGAITEGVDADICDPSCTTCLIGQSMTLKYDQVVFDGMNSSLISCPSWSFWEAHGFTFCSSFKFQTWYEVSIEILKT